MPTSEACRRMSFMSQKIKFLILCLLGLVVMATNVNAQKRGRSNSASGTYKIICDACNGSGLDFSHYHGYYSQYAARWIDVPNSCLKCATKGYVSVPASKISPEYRNITPGRTVTCFHCNGTGKTWTNARDSSTQGYIPGVCNECYGSGRRKVTSKYDLRW